MRDLRFAECHDPRSEENRPSVVVAVHSDVQGFHFLAQVEKIAMNCPRTSERSGVRGIVDVVSARLQDKSPELVSLYGNIGHSVFTSNEASSDRVDRADRLNKQTGEGSWDVSFL